MRPFRVSIPVVVAGTLALGAGPAVADVLSPQEVTGLRVDKSGVDLVLTWTDVTADVSGNMESLDVYFVYRGGTPAFVPDRAGGTNRLDTPVA
ncbi:MAG: hypothetical protein GTO33_10245, partial [Acidobacteria bacterium]|nr:hypothetical protein [Acidobacteriota bacterium]